MLPTLPATLERYRPGIDAPDPDETSLVAELDEALGHIRQTTYANGGRAIRSVHAKSHGLLQAELRVDNGLPEPLAQGVFARPASYPAIVRLSTVPGDLLPDSVSTPRGMSVKLLGVPGERLEGSERGSTQDFIAVNGPTFNAPNGRAFLGNMKLIAKTTDRAEGSKQVLSTVLRGAERVLEAVGVQSAKLKSLGGQPATHPLSDIFFTQLPIRYGDYIAKLSFAPLSDNLRELDGERLALLGHPDALRDAVLEFFATQTAVWSVRVQLCTGLAEMPIEPADVEWDEARSPYLRVGTLTALPQVAWSAERLRLVEDGMGFSPWHGIEAHRPLGSLMRLRKSAYASSQRFRSERNATPVGEPASAQLP